ncbi:putative holin-like toxin [Lacticaseibacillus parakribbianus]|nr:putative holin-like toxin [Lacticaseibacillus parakribbianus]
MSTHDVPDLLFVGGMFLFALLTFILLLIDRR